MENKKQKSVNIIQTICITIAGIFLLIQRWGFNSSFYKSSHTFLRFAPSIALSATLVLVMLVFGAVYRDKVISFREALRYWLLSEATLIVYYLILFIRHRRYILMWRFWGIFFPILTGSAILLTAIFFSMFMQPVLKKFLASVTNKQAFLTLSAASVLGFITSAGTLNVYYSFYGLYLVLFFAWGMFLGRLTFSKKTKIFSAIGGLVTLGFLSYGVPAINAIYWMQLLSGRSGGEWNPKFLANVSSPFILIISVSAFIVFYQVIDSFEVKHLDYFMMAIIMMQAPISGKALPIPMLTNSSFTNKFISSIIFAILLWVPWFVVEKYFFKLKFVKNALDYVDQFNTLPALIEDCWNRIVAFTIRHRLVILTWIWFYIISFASFLIVSDNMRIQASTAANINAIVYLLGTHFFSMVLTTIFAYALFAVFYFITTRYWTSNVLVSIIVIGWAVANKIKLTLRGEPIYPTEISEAANFKTLAPMVGGKTLTIVGISLLVVIAILIFLEIKFKVKKTGNWKRRGIWALLSLLLFMTPLRFNHTGTLIYRLSKAFDNRQSFRNPERDIQLNGPLLNTLNYIDLKVMNHPDNYSESSVKEVINKYQKVADEINKHRKYNIGDQTIVFNLSESFIDPYTVPTVKISGKDAIKYIHSLKKTTTYGSMLSAGYGGGTANMEWESLTGLNMGLFASSSLTPYVQIVPSHKFFPTIGMNFTYKSAIHPFIGTYYSRIENYNRFKFNKFEYLGSKYTIIDQKKLGKSSYNSDFTTYANGLKQINARQGGQFINLISIQNHMPFNNWYPNNEYMGKVSGELLQTSADKTQFATYVKGTKYTDEAVKGFIEKINKINKPITVVFYGDHYPSIINQSHTAQYPIQMHSTLYFIYSNKYAREHGAKAKLSAKSSNYVNTSDFIAMLLEQTNSKVTPYEALLTEIHKELPAITINYEGDDGYELVNQKTGEKVDPKTLTNSQQALLKDYEMVQYDITAGDAYVLKTNQFYGKNE
ncbi:MAG: sulfatase-like hydrolase/transferase [Lactobacillus sp.]|nr:sulfatase-like hydrolase/transferase [Lactobacillus sp.]